MALLPGPVARRIALPQGLWFSYRYKMLRVYACACKSKDKFIWRVTPPLVIPAEISNFTLCGSTQFSVKKTLSLLWQLLRGHTVFCFSSQMWSECARLWTTWLVSPPSPTGKCPRGPSVWWTCPERWWLSHCGERRWGYKREREIDGYIYEEICCHGEAIGSQISIR